MLDLEALERRLILYRAHGLAEVGADPDLGKLVLAYGVPLAADPKPKADSTGGLFGSSDALDLVANPPALPPDAQE